MLVSSMFRARYSSTWFSHEVGFLKLKPSPRFATTAHQKQGPFL